MSEINLAQYEAELDAYAATSRPPLNSVLVMQHGTPISEHYWRGFSAISYQHIYSVTKSFVSALVGVAVGDGKLNRSDTLADWFPEIGLGPQSHAASVTLRHLLTMTAGFSKSSKLASGDRILSLVMRDPAFPPGEHFHYSNDDVDLLASLLERAIGDSLIEYAHQRLFTPLGIWSDIPKSRRKRLWKVDRQGHPRGAFGLHLTAPEMATFGQLYLQSGKWQDVQLIPQTFIEASTMSQTTAGYPERVDYGYLWWVSTDREGRRAFFSSGAGGQYIYIHPDLELVVVITATFKNQDGRPHCVMVMRLVNKLLE